MVKEREGGKNVFMLLNSKRLSCTCNKLHCHQLQRVKLKEYERAFTASDVDGSGDIDLDEVSLFDCVCVCVCV